MDQTKVIAGSSEIVAAQISLTSKVDLGDAAITLDAQGMGPQTGTGMIELNSNGTIVGKAGDASITIATDIMAESCVQIDGGLLGTVSLANGVPVGFAQTIEMEAKTESINISNGNVPGAMQSITMCGLNQSIEISAGGLPISPMIQMSPLGIKLSCGPTSSVEITPAGVSIQGLLVSIEGEAGASVKAPMVAVSGDAVTQIEGAIVLVN